MKFKPPYLITESQGVWTVHTGGFIQWAHDRKFIYIDGRASPPAVYRVNCNICSIRRVRHYVAYSSATERTIEHFEKYHPDYLTIYTLATE